MPRSLQEIVQPLLYHLTVLLLCAFLGVGQAGAGSMMLLGVGGASGATNFLLSNTGSALLVNTGVKFLVQ